MGRFDSSRSRVAPVFDRLRCLDPTGGSWLSKLLTLPVREPPATVSSPVGAVLEMCLWPAEKRLPAPHGLLTWLIQNINKPEHESAWGGTVTREKREALVRRDPVRVAEALSLVALRPDERVWYVLEGQTCPDVFLSTDDAIVVIEGKRTEVGPTTRTSWMPVRHQMLRHLDAALELAGPRRLVGFFVVEADGNGDVPREWREAARATIDAKALVPSLPHRSEAERKAIADAFIGVTTWQTICRTFSIPSQVLLDEVVDSV